MDILGFLGFNKQENGVSIEDALEKKLTEVNSKSLDNPEVRKVYIGIGKIFMNYRSGKIPKAFKVIPNLTHWDELLALTNPSKWTPQSMYEATNIFSSNFDPLRAEQFYRKVNIYLNLVFGSCS